MWNPEILRKNIQQDFSDHSLVVVSNREPYLHKYENGKIIAHPSVGGVSVTFDSILKAANNGLWVAYGGSDADKEVVDKNDEVKLPPGEESYRLKRVWMTKKEQLGYYEGFSNEAIYPLCLNAFERPVFRDSDWDSYKKVNRRFAKKVVEAIGDKKAVIWVQDYHLALLPKFLRQLRPDLVIGQFWHIPWPAWEVFRICPWKKEILEGMLGNDILGFHRHFYVNNFLRTVARELEVNVSFDDLTVKLNKHRTKLVARPISVDISGIENSLLKMKSKKSKYINEVKPAGQLLIGIDRVDYTKGILERLQAIDRFLAENPNYLQKVTYIGIATPSRQNNVSYQKLIAKIKELEEQINKKYQTKNWKPINQFFDFASREEVILLMRDADICLVTPLDDGMNLVAKEFVAANTKGTLILSEFAGAAKDLSRATLVNPHYISEISSAIATSLEAPRDEKIKTLNIMKEHLRNNNLYRWAGKFLHELAKEVKS